MAPGDGLPHRPQPRRQIARPARQHTQAGRSLHRPRQALEQSRQGEVADPRRGQLDGQRQPVQAGADRRHGGGVGRGQHEGGVGGARPRHEQLDSGVRGWLGGERWPDRGRVGQRGDREVVLAGEAQDNAAGDQRREAGARGQQGGEGGAGGHDVLEVVEDQQRPALPQVGGQPLGQGPTAHLAQPQRLRDRGQDKAGLAQGVEGHEPDAVREVRGDLRGDVQGEPGLADAAWAGQRQQADVRTAQQGGGRRDLAHTADEGGERHRQVGGRF